MQKNRLTEYFAELDEQKRQQQVAVSDRPEPKEDSPFRSPALGIRRVEEPTDGQPPLGVLAMVFGGLLALAGVGVASKGMVIVGAATLLAGGMCCISQTENRRV